MIIPRRGQTGRRFLLLRDALSAQVMDMDVVDAVVAENQGLFLDRLVPRCTSAIIGHLLVDIIYPK